MTIKTIAKQIGRIAHELTISGLLLFFYLSGVYAGFPPAIQLVALKVTLVSMGFLHAHITGKIAFPTVNWGDHNEDKLEKILRIALYVVFVFAYAQGG